MLGLNAGPTACPGVKRRRVWHNTLPQPSRNAEPPRTATVCRPGTGRVPPVLAADAPRSGPRGPSNSPGVERQVAKWASLEEARSSLSSETQLLQSPASILGVLRQIKQLWGTSMHDPTQAAHIADILPMLSHALTQHVDQLRARDLVHAATMLGTLPACDTMLLLRLCEACRGNLGSVPGPTLVALLPVLAQRHLRPGDVLLAEILREVQGQLCGLSVGQQVLALLSLVRLGVRPTSAWLGAWEDASRAEHQGMSCEELSQAVWALAEIRFTPGPAWMAGFLGASQHRMISATGPQLAQLISGLGRLGAATTLSPAWRAAALHAAAGRLAALRAGDLARLLAGAADLGLRPEGPWVARAAAQVLSVMPQASARDLLDCLTALWQLSPPPLPLAAAAATAPAGSQVGAAAAAAAADSARLGLAVDEDQPELAPHPAWLVARAGGAAAGSAVGGRLPGDVPDAGGVAAGRVAADGVVEGGAAAAGGAAREVKPQASSPRAARGPSGLPRWCTRAWRSALLSEAHKRLPHFTATGLAQLLVALAQVQATPPHDWMGEYQSLLESKVEAVGCDELAAVPGALAALGITPRRQLVVGLLSASRSRLSLMSDEALLGMAGSIHLMPGGCDDHVWKEAFLRESSLRLGRMSYADLARLPPIAARLRLQPCAAWWRHLFDAMQPTGAGAAEGQPGPAAGLEGSSMLVGGTEGHSGHTAGLRRRSTPVGGTERHSPPAAGHQQHNVPMSGPVGRQAPAEGWQTAATGPEGRNSAAGGREESSGAASSGVFLGSDEYGGPAASLGTQALSDLLWGVAVSGVKPPQAWLQEVVGAARRRVVAGRSGTAWVGAAAGGAGAVRSEGRQRRSSGRQGRVGSTVR